MRGFARWLLRCSKTRDLSSHPRSSIMQSAVCAAYCRGHICIHHSDSTLFYTISDPSCTAALLPPNIWKMVLPSMSAVEYQSLYYSVCTVGPMQDPFSTLHWNGYFVRWASTFGLQEQTRVRRTKTVCRYTQLLTMAIKQNRYLSYLSRMSPIVGEVFDPSSKVARWSMVLLTTFFGHKIEIPGHDNQQSISPEWKVCCNPGLSYWDVMDCRIRRVLGGGVWQTQPDCSHCASAPSHDPSTNSLLCLLSYNSVGTSTELNWTELFL